MSEQPDQLFGAETVLARLLDIHNESVTLNDVERASLLAYIRDLQQDSKNFNFSKVIDPEMFRRETPSLDAVPVRQSTEEERRASNVKLDPAVLDYGSAGTLIDRAIHHLDEALPTGQRRRSELAFAMLRRGTEELAVWMRAKGYKV